MFTGREFDKDTGLYYYRARYYHPEIGRFLQTDPIGYGDGMNLYAYCGGNPANCLDPTGCFRIMWDSSVPTEARCGIEAVLSIIKGICDDRIREISQILIDMTCVTHSADECSMRQILREARDILRKIRDGIESDSTTIRFKIAPLYDGIWPYRRPSTDKGELRSGLLVRYPTIVLNSFTWTPYYWEFGPTIFHELIHWAGVDKDEVCPGGGYDDYQWNLALGATDLTALYYRALQYNSQWANWCVNNPGCWNCTCGSGDSHKHDPNCPTHGEREP